MRSPIAASLLVLGVAACRGSEASPTSALADRPSAEAVASSDDEMTALHVIGGDVAGTEDDLGFAFAGDKIVRPGQRSP